MFLIAVILSCFFVFKVRYLWYARQHEGSPAVHALLNNILGISNIRFQGDIDLLSVLFLCILVLFMISADVGTMLMLFM